MESLTIDTPRLINRQHTAVEYLLMLRTLIKQYRGKLKIVFDFDSTISEANPKKGLKGETFDDLIDKTAREQGNSDIGQAAGNICKNGMAGGDFRESRQARMTLLKGLGGAPIELLQTIADDTLVRSGFVELVSTIGIENIKVITGGADQMVRPVLERVLNLSQEELNPRIIANSFKIVDGIVADWDEDNCRVPDSDSKKERVEELVDGEWNDNLVLMIGDGSTDAVVGLLKAKNVYFMPFKDELIPDRPNVLAVSHGAYFQSQWEILALVMTQEDINGSLVDGTLDVFVSSINSARETLNQRYQGLNIPKFVLPNYL